MFPFIYWFDLSCLFIYQPKSPSNTLVKSFFCICVLWMNILPFVYSFFSFLFDNCLSYLIRSILEHYQKTFSLKISSALPVFPIFINHPSPVSQVWVMFISVLSTLLHFAIDCISGKQSHTTVLCMLTSWS